MSIEQIKIGFDNFSYVIWCPNTLKAAIVDPSFDSSSALRFISNKNLELEYIITTHYHSDHTSDIRRVKASHPSAKIIASEKDGAKLGENIDVNITGRERLNLGDVALEFILTPGHTSGGICIIVDNEALLTGDTLFIGDCGRTDLPDGSLEDMFNTLHKIIMSLPDHLIVYPGHDYGNKPSDLLGNQKRINKVLIARDFNEFSRIP
jgi:glyoxylase-like metal-dependent hydrolase (beta-lactamase superfamily II)